MKQRTVNDLIKDLNKVKKQFGGDIPVNAHLQSMEDANGGDVSHDDFCLYVEKINRINEDNGSVSKRKYTVLSIYGGEYCPEDFKSKPLKTKTDLN